MKLKAIRLLTADAHDSQERQNNYTKARGWERPRERGAWAQVQLSGQRLCVARRAGEYSKSAAELVQNGSTEVRRKARGKERCSNMTAGNGKKRIDQPARTVHDLFRLIQFSPGRLFNDRQRERMLCMDVVFHSTTIIGEECGMWHIVVLMFMLQLNSQHSLHWYPITLTALV